MESKRTLSVKITENLYQRLQSAVGKGKISNFIEVTVKEKLTKQEQALAREYQEAWQNKNRWREFKE
jgi:uncharacterized protein YeaC (DUF1315 family)